MKKVFIDYIEGEYERKIIAALNWLEAVDNLKSGTKVFIKPNLTYPKFKPGVTTTPQLLKALIKVLSDLGCQITVGESDGGYNSHEVRDVYHDFGLFEYEKEYGIKVVNLSKLPYDFINIRKFRREFNIEFPKILKYETDVFITLPVPKVHAMTKISLSYKNQWGCVPNVMRLRYHSVFDEAIYAINQQFKKKLTIIDGTYGLTRTGPMAGDSFELGWLAASDSFEAADLIVAKIMGYDLKRIDHYRMAYKNNLMPKEEEIKSNQDYNKFKSDKFYLDRDIWSYLALSSWFHPAISHFFYESMFSDILHKIMYTFREKPVKDEDRPQKG
jgi:uncharacterized protein (DUF362 family)